jgi:hypothetical protein
VQLRERDPERPDPTTPSREHVRDTLIERQIREAMEAGSFDGLPHRGRRLPLTDDSLAGDRALSHLILKNAGMAPPWIEADKTVRELLAQRDRLLSRASRVSPLSRGRVRIELERLVEAANSAVLRLNHEAPSPRQQRRPLDVERELERLERAFSVASERPWSG